MSYGFLKFKRKMRTALVVRTSLVAACLGVTVFAVQWLLAMLSDSQADFLMMGLIGAGAAAVLAGVLLMLQWPTDRRLAKKLDNKLQLHEKVQTMVAFREEDSDMICLQREHADSILQQIPTKRMRSKKAWLILIAPVLAAACLAGAIVVNAMESTEPPQPQQPDSSWSYHDIYRIRLQEVIAYVRGSQMDQVPKEAIVAQLESLDQELVPIRKESLMKQAVVKTITKIHNIVKDNNSYHKLVASMNKTTSESVALLAAGIRSLDGVAITAQIEKIKASFEEKGVAESAKLFSDSLAQALTASGVGADDPLYAALQLLTEELAAVTEETTAEQLDAIFAKAEESLKTAVVQPYINETVETETINRLMAIFEISRDQIPNDVLNDFKDDALSGKPSDEEMDDAGSGVQGGIGDGENKFGSDDTIYDPYTGTWVSYGEVLERYRTIMLEYAISEQASDEIEQMLTYYFVILNDGTNSSN